jgi:ABC-type transport system involved in multi-copper enzyme maturation permease subunit
VHSRPHSLFGPLVWWELVRLARLGHATRACVLLLYTLLLAVAVLAFWKSYPASPVGLLRDAAGSLSGAWPADAERARRLAEFARLLPLVLFEAQLLLVAAVAPAYAAAAVSEEKDRRTLELLLTTDLTDREVVWGKAASRVLFVLAAVAAGTPVFALALLLGGAGGEFVAAGYALTAGTVVLSAAIGVGAACHSPDTRAALVRAYGQSAAFVFGVVVPPLVLLSPFAMLYAHHVSPGDPALRALAGFGYPVGQAAVAWMLLAGATRAVRRPGPTAGPPEPTAYPEPPRGRAVWVLGDADEEPTPLPPLADADPVLWKERHAGRTSPAPVLDRPVRILGKVVAVAAFALFAAGGFTLVERAVRVLDPAEAERLLSRGPPPDNAGWVLAAAGVLASGLYLVPLAVGATGCVAGERSRGTLDALLLTAVGRRGVVWSKVRAHAERGLVFAGVAAAALGAGFGADSGAKLGLAAVAAFAGGVALVAGLGAWLSVRCATPARAFRLCLPAVVAVIGLPVVVWNVAAWDRPTRPAEVLAYTAAAFAALGLALGWRAGAELGKGG